MSSRRFGQVRRALWCASRSVWGPWTASPRRWWALRGSNPRASAYVSQKLPTHRANLVLYGHEQRPKSLWKPHDRLTKRETTRSMWWNRSVLMGSPVSHLPRRPRGGIASWRHAKSSSGGSPRHPRRHTRRLHARCMRTGHRSAMAGEPRPTAAWSRAVACRRLGDALSSSGRYLLEPLDGWA